MEGSKLDTIHVDRPANSRHKTSVVAISDAKIKLFILSPHGRRRPKELYIMTLSDASHHATARNQQACCSQYDPCLATAFAHHITKIGVPELVIRVLTCLNSKMFIGGLNWETTDRKWPRITLEYGVS